MNLIVEALPDGSYHVWQPSDTSWGSYLKSLDAFRRWTKRKSLTIEDFDVAASNQRALRHLKVEDLILTL